MSRLMLRSIIARRWIVSLLVLVFCAGLGAPAFAGSSGKHHHAAATVVAHGTCLHAAAGSPKGGTDDASGALAAADCALAHLGQALLDRAPALLVRVRPCSYPPVRPNDLVDWTPKLEGDPPRRTRIA